MPITLNTLTFDESHTTVTERFEEVGGRDARRIEIAGVIVGEHAPEDVEAKLDAVIAAASSSESVSLSIRPGRLLLVRRVKFQRDVSPQTLTGAFTLVLEADDPVEESIVSSEMPWSIAGSGSTISIFTAGNTDALPAITLTAIGDIVNASISDGSRMINYLGTVRNGSTLTFDSSARVARLDGVDVTPYTVGTFPRISPPGGTLTFLDAVSSSHTAAATASFHDRWI